MAAGIFQNGVELGKTRKVKGYTSHKLNERTDLKPKPEPDGYLEALKNLEADPKLSIILEDSNSGIQAAKASGAYVIGFKGNLVDGYVQKGADVYADTMQDVIKLVEAYSG